MKDKIHQTKKDGVADGYGAAAAAEMFREVAKPDAPVIVQGVRSYREFRVVHG